MPAKDLEKCRRRPTLRPACPTRVPEADRNGYHYSFANDPAGKKIDLWVFGVEWNAPSRNRLNREDKPPGFVHVTVDAGDLSPTFGFGWPGKTPTPKGQPEPRDLGGRKWNGHRGRLVLAPRYPFGGLHGSHLIFRWPQRGNEYAVSLHGWIPLHEAEAALREMVESIP